MGWLVIDYGVLDIQGARVRESLFCFMHLQVKTECVFC